MRPFEVSLVLLLGLYIYLTVFSRKKWYKPLLIIGVVVLFVHLAIEPYRWQMLPLYVLTLMVVVLTAYVRYGKHNLNTLGRFWQIVIILVGLLLLTPAVALPVLLPVPKLPEPSGRYSVGTLNKYFIDPNRAELYAEQPVNQREFLIQVWYPTDPGEKGQVAPWLDNMGVMGPAIANWIGMPSFFLDHIRLARTNSIMEAAIASDGATFPILIFSHGWGGFRSQNTYQVEELASNGYVVIAVQHTYGAVATVFPDGHIAHINPQALPSGLPENEYRSTANQLVNQWAADMAFVIDQLALLNNSDPEGRFSGRLDLANIGVFGHSTGGGAAIEFCANDQRCKAIIGLDAFMAPVSDKTINRGLNQPALFLFSQAWPSDTNNRLFDQLQVHNRNISLAYTIKGTSHYDFTDLPMLSPLAAQLGLKGPLNGKRTLHIINDFTLAFFNQHLLGIDSPLSIGLSEAYPEITKK